MPEATPIVKPTRQPFKDIEGQTFNRLTVMSYAGQGAAGSLWNCRCVCGKTTVVVGTNLRNGNTKSCGCFRQEETTRRKTVHGYIDSPEYGVWNAMRARCTNPKCNAYKRYGAKGIRVCQRWMKSFTDFIADMGPRPSPQHSIDRYPDNDGNYEPGNCRWATAEQQAANKHTTRLFEFRGRRLMMSQWSKETGINVRTLWNRVRWGWPIERVLTTPAGPNGRKKCP